jgi:hypothetical protein
MHREAAALSRILLKPIIILIFSWQSMHTWAGCSDNGDITSGTSPILLNSAGCADDGSMQAQLLTGSTLTINGSAITAPIVIGSSIPWTITLQSNSQINATSNGIVGIDGVGALPINLINNGSVSVTDNGALLTGGGNVTNYGDISGNFNGVDLSSSNGGTVVSDVTSLVNNFGTILGGTTGIHMGLGGTINNNGTIDGEFAIQTEQSENSIISAPLVLNNSGTIGNTTTTNTAVLINAGGTFNNFAGAQILAGTFGIAVQNGTGTVNNSGTITASLGRGVRFSDSATGGTVNNEVTGVIHGLGTRSISFIVCPGTVNNAGLISGGTVATINMQVGNSTVNNTGTIIGDVLFEVSNDTFSKCNRC